MEYRLVSIIIPIYNMAKYLHETLVRCLLQIILILK